MMGLTPSRTRNRKCARLCGVLARRKGDSRMVEQPAYSMLIRWSEEDGAFLVTLPEWEGRLQNWYAATHGATYADAAKNGQEVLEMLVEDATEQGTPLPQPRSFAMSA